MSVRILLVDDHQIIREGLRALVEKEPDMTVVAEADEGRAAVGMAHELSPDVVVMDVAMPGLNGIEATRQIRQESQGVSVIALSIHADRQYVARMFEAGAAGYLLKDCAFEELATAIRTVCDNRIYLSPKIAGTVVEDYLRRLGMSEDPAFSPLSPREREVLQLLAEGYGTKQIAARLHLSAKTVETHRSRIMSKLSIRSVAELTKYAIRAGLTSLEP